MSIEQILLRFGHKSASLETKGDRNPTFSAKHLGIVISQLFRFISAIFKDNFELSFTVLSVHTKGLPMVSGVMGR